MKVDLPGTQGGRHADGPFPASSGVFAQHRVEAPGIQIENGRVDGDFDPPLGHLVTQSSNGGRLVKTEWRVTSGNVVLNENRWGNWAPLLAMPWSFEDP
jgi:hypothetical protein